MNIWSGEQNQFSFNKTEYMPIVKNIRTPIAVVFDEKLKKVGIAIDGEISNKNIPQRSNFKLIGLLPAMYPEWLGDRGFCEVHGLRFAYVGGAMARGIASKEIVIELAKNGMLGFYGSAGVRIDQVEKDIQFISSKLDKESLSWGINLIHTPDNQTLEKELINLYIKYGVKRVSVAAFTNVSNALVKYALNGVRRDSNGNIVRKNYIFAKVSHPSTAQYFLAPAAEKIVNELLQNKEITEEEADLSKYIPIAEDFDIEGDSGGHTDNRVIAPLFSNILYLANTLSKKYNYTRRIRLGIAGGIGTPQSVASAFAMGASHVVVGSVHQACIESGTSTTVKSMLAKASMADTMMTSSADMFEMGVKVQVLKLGTMMGVRGNKLYEIYKKYDSIEDIPKDLKENVEKNYFKMKLEEVWEKTAEFFSKVAPNEVLKGEKDAKYKMALIFRWYIGNSSKWPIVRDLSRVLDYQIWTGPAVGAFNEWVKGSFLEKLENRTIKQASLNLMEGGAVLTRVHQLRTYGLDIDTEAFIYEPDILEI